MLLGKLKTLLSLHRQSHVIGWTRLAVIKVSSTLSCQSLHRTTIPALCLMYKHLPYWLVFIQDKSLGLRPRIYRIHIRTKRYRY